LGPGLVESGVVRYEKGLYRAGFECAMKRVVFGPGGESATLTPTHPAMSSTFQVRFAFPTDSRTFYGRRPGGPDQHSFLQTERPTVETGKLAIGVEWAVDEFIKFKPDQPLAMIKFADDTLKGLDAKGLGGKECLAINLLGLRVFML
jgi:hypothetical protein